MCVLQLKACLGVQIVTCVIYGFNLLILSGEPHHHLPELSSNSTCWLYYEHHNKTPEDGSDRGFCTAIMVSQLKSSKKKIMPSKCFKRICGYCNHQRCTQIYSLYSFYPQEGYTHIELINKLIVAVQFALSATLAAYCCKVNQCCSPRSHVVSNAEMQPHSSNDTMQSF